MLEPSIREVAVGKNFTRAAAHEDVLQHSTDDPAIGDRFDCKQSRTGGFRTVTEFAISKECRRYGNDACSGVRAGHGAIEAREICRAAEIWGCVRVGGDESGGGAEHSGNRNPRPSSPKPDRRGPDLALIGGDVRQHRGKGYGSLVGCEWR